MPGSASSWETFSWVLPVATHALAVPRLRPAAGGGRLRGLGAADRHRGLAGDGAQVPVAFPGLGASGTDSADSYQAIADRRGTKIATTAIARKLLTRAYHLLTDASSAGAPS
jgi:hypothetical protein